jgi:hypothetical protein
MGETKTADETSGERKIEKQLDNPPPLVIVFAHRKGRKSDNLGECLERYFLPRRKEKCI